MATPDEIKAAIAAAEARGRKDLADKLRAYLPAEPPAKDATKIEAAIAKAEAKGRTDLADKLRAYLPAQPVAKPVADGPQEPPAPIEPGSPEDVTAKTDMLAQFEAANPALAGMFNADALPQVGSVVMGKGGGGKSGGARITVQPWQGVRPDTFGDTAAAMTEGPIAAMKAFGGGLTGGDSPSRGYLANDPYAKSLPGPVLTGLGAIGDAGGAALSAVGAGLSGVIGLATEAVPGQNAQAEFKLGNDLLGMSMFAVPELAGGSSVIARAASAPKVAPVAVPGRLAGDVVAAERLGIPVMRTDVSPPTTFFGNVAQKTGEAIPLAGTGAVRAKQNAARVSAAQKFAREYGADSAAPAIDDVAAALLEKRSADIKKLTTQKREVIDRLAEKGTVPTPKAVAAIDVQIEKLRKQNMAGLEPVIAKLEDFKTSLVNQRLTEIEANRAVIGEAFSGFDMGAIRGVGEKALSAVYGPLRNDMADFIKAVGEMPDLNKWASANAKLAAMAGDLGNTVLKRSLSKGEASPEIVRSMLFSAKPSDLKLLYQNLNEDGRASARTAVIQEALGKANGIDELSPEKFKLALGKLGNQVGVFFKGEDFAAAEGLLRALQLTKRAGVAGVAPLTGVQNLPAAVGILVSSMFGGSIPATAAALGGIGGIARIYEATGVKAALRAVAKAETPKAKAAALQSMDKALIDAGVPTGTAATQGAANNAAPDYEPLWQKYGGAK